MILKRLLERTGALSVAVATAVAVLAWLLAPPPHSASAQFPSQATFAGTSGASSVNAQTLTLANMPVLVVGVPITFFPGGTNTGPATINLNAIGNTTVLRPSSLGLVGLSGGELASGVLTTVVYDGTNLDIVAPVNPAPVGSTVELRGTSSTAPPGYLIEDGSCVSQTTYAALFATVGSTYGSCGGGLFAVPDSRGTMFAALDNQGVNGAANRITSAGSGCTATAIGQCGLQNQTLTLAQTPTGITSTNGAQAISVQTPGGTTVAANANYSSFGVVTNSGSTSFAALASSASGASFLSSFSGTNSISATSNNTGGATHPILNPVLLGRRAIKY